MSHPVPAAVLAAFPIGAVSSVEVVTHGLIHATYKVEAEKGTFIIQRLHPVLSSAETAEDFFAVTSFLNEKKFPAPQCVKSTAGSVLVQDDEGKPWRLQTFLQGQTIHKAEDVSLIRESAALYARFHHVMADFPYTFKSEKVLHDTPKIYNTFEETLAKYENSPLFGGVADEVALIREELPKLLLPESIPLRVVHGDPKISNILFSDDKKAVALVDLDTCNRRPILVELGDAFRSWCGIEEDRSDNHFRVDVFEAGWKAYQAAAGNFLTKEEIDLVPQGIALITLELASRFLADYFNDSYFGWDAARYPSRRGHNLARTRGQIALYKDLMKKMKEVKVIIAA